MTMRTLGLCMLLTAALMVFGATTADASLVHYRWTFTGDDLFNNVFVNGADGSSAADNGLFDGARLLRVGTNGNHADAGRTYVESQHDNFNDRWAELVDAGAVLDSFNLWGLDGRGVNWGEDYKPTAWLSATGPDGWSTGVHTYSDLWGAPPAGYITDDFPWWYEPGGGIALGDPGSWGDYVFTVDVAIDTDEAWWGQDTQGAPNSLFDPSEFTVWFGGYVGTDDYGWHIYEGNMVLSSLTGQVEIVPEPATITLLGLGLGGLAVRRYRRKLKA